MSQKLLKQHLEIEKSIGAREPKGKEASFKKARIFWKNQILWDTPEQIQEASGNLDKLTNLLPNSEKVKCKLSFCEERKRSKGFPGSQKKH